MINKKKHEVEPTSQTCCLFQYLKGSTNMVRLISYAFKKKEEEEEEKDLYRLQN